MEKERTEAEGNSLVDLETARLVLTPVTEEHIDLSLIHIFILFIVFFAVALILGVLVIVDYITNIFQTVTSFGDYWETAL